MIDLRSDTVTKPTPAMREAMASADVGDDVFGEDPSINELQRRAAELTGKESALFVPSGTMANLLAFLSQTRPGDSVLMHEDAHPFHYESGNLGMVAGVLVRTVPGAYGIMHADDVLPRIVPDTPDHHFSPTTVVAVENTTNRGGGAYYDLANLETIYTLAHNRELNVHCDGARIFNAHVETGISVAQYARFSDTFSFCLAKGLGAPVGSVLTGSATTIERAHRYRKMLGGGMRQAGILAAAGSYALEHHVERLKDDHARARRFRKGLESLPGLRFPLPSPTNMVYIEIEDARRFAERLKEHDVLVMALTPVRIRCVFHLDISDADLERAINAFKQTSTCLPR